MVRNRKITKMSSVSNYKNIKTSSECSWAILIAFNTVHVSISVGVSLVNRVKVEFLENPSGKQETSAVRSSIVGQTNLDSVPGVTSD